MSDLSIMEKAKREGVALSLNPDGTIRAVGAADVLASLRPALLNNKPRIVEHLKQRATLAQFRFDLVEAEIGAGHPAAELDRVNNMAWEFMQVDGLDFNTAIRMAAEICVACPPAPCEAAYADVRSLWQQQSRQGGGTR